MSDNRIYFRRTGKVAAEHLMGQSEFNFAEVASFDANLRKLGYTLDGELAKVLLTAPVSAIKTIHDDVIAEAKHIKGVRRYSPMYPNFPKQVMEADEAELYINAMMHYFGTSVGMRILPKYEAAKRPELDFDESKFKRVGLGGYDDYRKVMVSLFNSKSAFSETDREDIKALHKEFFMHVLNLASGNGFANRENKATLLAHGMTVGVSDTFVVGHIDTATDVLRLAVAMSDGDVSLAENTRFRSFKRSERRFLLYTLANLRGESREEDMARHAAKWKRLGERLHPSEHGMADVFKAVRDNGSVESFNARVEKAITGGDPLGAARILRHRAGEFARRLDKVLRMTDGNVGLGMEIVHQFSRVAEQASPTVLLQARNNFVTREGRNVRAFFPKGSVAKMQTRSDQRGGIKMIVANAAVSSIDAALTKQFKGRESLGKVYVDTALKGIAIPFGGRSASKSVKTVGRGSRLPLGDDTNVVRFFIWWKDAKDGGWGYGSHTDIDLSAVMFGDDFKYVDAITYYNLRNSGAAHSGDITSAPNGASEFIDIDLDTLRRRGIRYVAMTLHSYSGQDYVELPECFAGFMERKDLMSGEIYDPRTVTHKVDLTAKSKGATPFIFDIVTGEAVWVDLSMQISQSAGNVANSKGQITSLVEAMTTLTPPNLYDLFVLHGAARGSLVFDRDDADTVFAFDGDVTPFDTEVILDKYL